MKKWYYQNGKWISSSVKFGDEPKPKPADDPLSTFSPEQQAVVDKIIGKRLETERKKQAEALKAVEELTQKANMTAEENQKLQASIQELREANMTAEEKGKEKWKREIGNRDAQIAKLADEAKRYKERFEDTVKETALRRYVAEAGFHPKAVDHFIAVSKPKSIVEEVDGQIVVKVNAVAVVNGVSTPTVLPVDKYVKDAAASDEWSYAIPSTRRGGLGMSPVGNPTGGIPVGSTNDRVAAGLKKEGLIK